MRISLSSTGVGSLESKASIFPHKPSAFILNIQYFNIQYSTREELTKKLHQLIESKFISHYCIGGKFELIAQSIDRGLIPISPDLLRQMSFQARCLMSKSILALCVTVAQMSNVLTHCISICKQLNRNYENISGKKGIRPVREQ